MTTPPAPRPRVGSLGCLGAFSILCLTAFTILELGLAWWLSPSWFDRFAFWKAPRVVAGPVSLEGAAAEAARARWRAEELPRAPRKPSPDPTKPELLDAARVEGDYAPARGAAVQDPGNGAAVQIPAGALARAAKVSLTPALRIPAAMAPAIAGPVYEVCVDGRDHTDFGRPIEVSIPYVKGLVPDQDAVVTVWENGRWVPLPSKVDPAKGIVTGTSSHASLFSVSSLAKIAARIGFTPLAAKGLLVLGALLAAAENDTTRAAAFSAIYGRSEEYETPEGNFKIHYYKHGAAKIPRDWEVLGNPLLPKAEGYDPIYVRRMGHWLEFARKELHAEGFALPPAKLIRYDCFLLPVGASGLDLGESFLGGPLFISSKIQEIAAIEKVDGEDLMKATCAHELLHVAQGKHYGTIKSELGITSVEPFCEADAEYNSWRFWRKRNLDDSFHVSKYILPTLGLTARPLDKADVTDRYAYSIWFEWMQHRFGEATAMEFLLEAHKGGDGSLASLDAAARKVLAGHSIPDLGTAMAEFAVDYYHRDWWTATLVPRAVKTDAVSSGITKYFDDGFGFAKGAKSEFFAVSRKISDGSVVRKPFHQLKRASLDHLTAVALYSATETLAPDADDPQPRLVVEVEGPAAGDPGLRVSVAKGTMGNPFGPGPAAGTPGDVVTIPISGGSGRTTIDRFGGRNGPNFITVLVTNRSLDRDLGGVTLRRWLLEPPSFAQLHAPEGPTQPKWLVKWKPSLLEPDREAFSTYRLYRRPQGASKSSKTLVRDVSASERRGDIVQAELVGDDAGNYVYSVAVVDVRGNESEPRDADLTDPFIGTWDGQFTLVEGSFLKPIMEAMRKSADEADAKAKARIAGIAEPARRQREQQEWESMKQSREKLIELIRQFLSGAEQAARMGVPMQFKIRSVNGQYRFRVSELMWGMVPVDADANSEVELRRSGRLSLRFTDLPPEVAPLELTLHRMDPEGKKPNVIRQDRYILETKGDAAKELPLRCVVRWEFERLAPSATAPK